MRNPKTKRSPRLRKTIHPLTAIVEIEMEAGQVKPWVGFLRKILEKSIRQSSNTPVTSVDTTAIKKDKKQGNREVSQVEYYAYYKKYHYANK